MRSHLVSVALVFAVACGGQQPQQAGGGGKSGPAITHARADVKEVLATVAGAPIGGDDLRQAASRNPPADGRDHTKDERKALLDALVEEEVLFQEALKKGLYHDTKVRKILVNLLLREEVYSQVRNDSLTDEELRAYYDAHKEEFITPEKVQVRRILFRIREDRDDAASKAEATKVHAEIRRDPRLFSELASKHSDGPYKRRGGDLGFVSKDGKPGVDKAVIEQAFAMKIDQVSAPLKINGAYHILQLVNRRERTERSFEQMKGSVVRMVKQGKHESLKGEFIKSTKAGYEVSVDDKAMGSVDLSRRSLSRPPAPAGADKKPHGPGDGHGHDH